MSKRIVDDNGRAVVVLCREPDAQCELCGKVAELRPYGPNGESICYECGMKNPEMTDRRMGQFLFGEPLDS